MAERIEVIAICSGCGCEKETDIRKDLLTKTEILSGKVYYHKAHCKCSQAKIDFTRKFNEVNYG